mgnify:CR=1 FL=1
MRKIPSDMTPGTRHMTKQCGELEIVEYFNKSNVSIFFVATGSEKTVHSSSIRRGSVKDKYALSVFGVGFIGEGEFKPSYKNKLTKLYSTWSDMLRRCYDPKRLLEKQTYIGCTVCEEWHNFQNFAEWMSKQDYKGKDLDKDIKFNGNKIYSPDNCVFVTHAENVIEARAKHYKFISPEGKLVDIYNLTEFCRDKDLDTSAMVKVHFGNLKQYKGWRKA